MARASPRPSAGRGAGGPPPGLARFYRETESRGRSPPAPRGPFLGAAARRLPRPGAAPGPGAGPAVPGGGARCAPLRSSPPRVRGETSQVFDFKPAGNGGFSPARGAKISPVRVRGCVHPARYRPASLGSHLASACLPGATAQQTSVCNLPAGSVISEFTVTFVLPA